MALVEILVIPELNRTRYQTLTVSDIEGSEFDTMFGRRGGSYSKKLPGYAPVVGHMAIGEGISWNYNGLTYFWIGRHFERNAPFTASMAENDYLPAMTSRHASPFQLIRI